MDRQNHISTVEKVIVALQTKAWFSFFVNNLVASQPFCTAEKTFFGQ